MQKLLVIPLLVLVFGCASIISKSTYPVTFDSNPSGANIVITDHNGNRMYEGHTPTTLTLSTKKGYFQGASYTIEASLDGYNPGRTTLDTGFDGWYIGNILFGGLIGMLIVDPATGAMWTLDERVVVSLGATRSSGSMDDPQLSILTIDQITPEQRAHLIPVN